MRLSKRTNAIILWIISIALIYRTMGSDFLGSVTYANLNGVEGAATPVMPFPTLLTGLGVDSVLLTILIALGFIGWIWLWIPTQILYPTRALVAWSLDRVAPDKLGTAGCGQFRADAVPVHGVHDVQGDAHQRRLDHRRCK
jgi:hypothetical protein